jgi:hypothetical protein
MATEVVRVAAFTTVEFEDGDWDGPHRQDDLVSYKSKNNTASLRVTLNGKVVFDKDFPKGKTILIDDDVIHLPEGAGPEI